MNTGINMRRIFTKSDYQSAEFLHSAAFVVDM